MIHDDGTMDVEIDGETKRRKIDHVVREHGRCFTYPVLEEGEEIMWTISDPSVPLIVKRWSA